LNLSTVFYDIHQLNITNMPRRNRSKKTSRTKSSKTFSWNQSEPNRTTNMDIFCQLDFTEEGNTKFNDFMDKAEEDIFNMEYLMEGLREPMSELEKAFYDKHNWYSECECCFESNFDCQCMPCVMEVPFLTWETRTINVNWCEYPINRIVPIVRRAPVEFMM
jgi:hypothetical protein